MKKEKQDSKGPNIVGLQGRMFATIIDLFLSMLILLPFTTVAYPPEVVEVMNKAQTGQITKTEADLLLQDFMLEGGGLANAFSNMTIEFLISGIVVVLFWFYRSGTPGKIFLQMKIVDAVTLSAPSKIRLIIRYLGYIVSGVPLCLGFFWISWDKRHQGWHDKMANTMVVYENEAPVKRFLIAISAMIVVLSVLMFLGI